jgi:hypothetical protein
MDTYKEWYSFSLCALSIEGRIIVAANAVFTPLKCSDNYVLRLLEQLIDILVFCIYGSCKSIGINSDYFLQQD